MASWKIGSRLLAIPTAFMLGIVLGLTGASSTWSANEPADDFFRMIEVDPRDQAFAPIFGRNPNAAIVMTIDTEKDGVEVVKFTGKFEDVTGQKLNISNVRNARAASALIVEYQKNPRCKWVKMDGTEVLVSGNPSQCRN